MHQPACFCRDFWLAARIACLVFAESRRPEFAALKVLRDPKADSKKAPLFGTET
jgi:hypothetical protein